MADNGERRQGQEYNATSTSSRPLTAAVSDTSTTPTTTSTTITSTPSTKHAGTMQKKQQTEIVRPRSLSPTNDAREHRHPNQIGDSLIDQQPQRSPETHTTAQPYQIADVIKSFWQEQLSEVENTTINFKFHNLPLARIKKVMKADDEIKNMMISAEAPIVFSRACEMFILELTMRAWQFTEESKRCTLQKPDVSSAASSSDIYDFLIDIVPRDEMVKSFKKDEHPPYYMQQNLYNGAPQEQLAYSHQYQYAQDQAATQSSSHYSAYTHQG